MNNKEKKYILVAFPFPSASLLHAGHFFSYSIIDSYCRYLRYIGHEVFQPFGFDSFGLPTQQYAKKVGREPREVAYENIANFRGQMDRMNTQYETLFATSDPSYIKWTQWLFLKLLEHDMAYKAEGEVDHCSSCETVLAREQVKDGKCERCSTPVEKKVLTQWYFRITKYTDRLLNGLDSLDWPKSTINAQRNWLANQHDWCVSRQRDWGCPIPLPGESDTMDTFVDSSFYYVRYCDPNNEEELCAKDKFQPVDLYVIGAEHTTMHLIYARFIHMFLYDIGVVPTEIAFKRLVHNGFILNNGVKMSKSLGNVVNPDDYEPDALRAFLMSLNHFFDGGSWTDKGIKGIYRFIGRMKEWMSRTGTDEVDLNSFEKQIFRYTEAFKFNKVVSDFMILYNNNKEKNLTVVQKEWIVRLLEIYMPGIREKL